MHTCPTVCSWYCWTLADMPGTKWANIHTAPPTDGGKQDFQLFFPKKTKFDSERVGLAAAVVAIRSYPPDQKISHQNTPSHSLHYQIHSPNQGGLRFRGILCLEFAVFKFSISWCHLWYVAMLQFFANSANCPQMHLTPFDAPSTPFCGIARPGGWGPGESWSRWGADGKSDPWTLWAPPSSSSSSSSSRYLLCKRSSSSY